MNAGIGSKYTFKSNTWLATQCSFETVVHGADRNICAQTKGMYLLVTHNIPEAVASGAFSYRPEPPQPLARYWSMILSCRAMMSRVQAGPWA